MALAIGAGAIFLRVLYSPSSFYSALLQTESQEFYEQPQKTRMELWRSVYQSMSQGSILRSRVALDLMLRTITASEHEDVDASSALDAYRNDPHNDLTRLAAAMVFVAADTPPSVYANLTPDAARKLYDALGTILDLTTPSGFAGTCHIDIINSMRPAYRSHFSRPDVATAITEIDALYFAIPARAHPAYMEAFPAMQLRLGAIADKLEAAGNAAEAARCRAWFRRPMVEVIEREPDTRMRLLCIDLLLRDLPEASPARQTLARMRDDFVQHAAESPLDRTDPAAMRTAIAPAEYRSVQGWLFAAIALALIAAGAGGAYVVALGLSPFVVKQKAEADRTLAPALVRWLLAVLLIVLCVYVCAASAAPGGPYSAHWTLQMIILSIWVGLGISFAFAGFHDRPFEHRWRIRLAFILPLAPMLVYFRPPVWVVHFSRYVDKWMSPMWAGAGIAALGAIAAIALNIRSLRAARMTAAMISTTAICLALAAYAVHSIADTRWQDAVVTGRQDEFAARLGGDWRERLLAPIKQELLRDSP